MRKEITLLLQELERRDTAEREQGMSRAERARNLRPEAGRFLNLLIRIARPRLIVEVGTSNGYSTLWLAEAAQAVGGSVISLEVREGRHYEAQANLAQAGLADVADLRLADAHEEIPGIKGPFDLVFLDAEKEDYVALAERLLPKLPWGGLLVADNITSHAETKPYLAALAADASLLTTVAPIGHGLALTMKLGKPFPEAFVTTLAAQEERGRTQKSLAQVPRDVGALLYMLARASGAKRILELGASGGYATLWLAQAARATKGHVTTIERDSAKVNLARRNLGLAGVADSVSIEMGDAERALDRVPGPFDFIFFDADPHDQIDYLDALLPSVSPGGLLVSNSHLTNPIDLADYTAYVRSAPDLASLLVPLGAGIEVTWKMRPRRPPR